MEVVGISHWEFGLLLSLWTVNSKAEPVLSATRGFCVPMCSEGWSLSRCCPSFADTAYSPPWLGTCYDVPSVWSCVSHTLISHSFMHKLPQCLSIWGILSQPDTMKGGCMTFLSV